MTMQPLFDLTGRVALVTGGGSGIGRAIALALAGAGADIVVAGRRSGPLRETVTGIERLGRRAAAATLDLAAFARSDAPLPAAVSAFGAPDILVNAAGLNLRQRVDEVTPDGWDATLSINLAAPFFLARRLVPAMRERAWGRIITIASLQSVRAFPDSLPYGASKGGVCQLTRAMAETWSRHGITANAIAPGFFPTPLTEAVFKDTARAERLAAQTAVGRNGRLEDLHGIAVFLAARASDYITGQTIFVDGGFTAK